MGDVVRLPRRPPAFALGIPGEDLGQCTCTAGCDGRLIVLENKNRDGMKKAEIACSGCGETIYLPVREPTNKREARELDGLARERMGFSVQEWGNLRSLILREVGHGK